MTTNINKWKMSITLCQRGVDHQKSPLRPIIPMPDGKIATEHVIDDELLSSTRATATPPRTAVLSSYHWALGV